MTGSYKNSTLKDKRGQDECTANVSGRKSAPFGNIIEVLISSPIMKT